MLQVINNQKISKVNQALCLRLVIYALIEKYAKRKEVGTLVPDYRYI